MAYFEDLSGYCYLKNATEYRGERNVGWLSIEHSFDIREPAPSFLDLLWSFCEVSVHPSRGLHQCEFCTSPDWFLAERSGKRLLLGSAEMRVFSLSGVIYAAPNLIYHYVSVHHYRPPDEFVIAVTEGPRPGTSEYFDALKGTDYEWENTYSPDAAWDSARKRFRTLHR